MPVNRNILLFILQILFTIFIMVTKVYPCECEKNIKSNRMVFNRQNINKKMQTAEDVKLKAIEDIKANNVVVMPRVIYSEKFQNIKFVGAEKCRLCHSVEYRKWQKTKHASAYGDMEIHYEEEKTENQKDKIEKTACESCHTTGYGYKYGFSDKQSTNSLIGVQCEVCHGPGGDHCKNPKQVCMTFGDNPIPESLCKSCHKGEISKGFEFNNHLDKIKCK